ASVNQVQIFGGRTSGAITCKPNHSGRDRRASLPVRHPDVLDPGRAAQELAPLSLAVIQPVAFGAVVNPCRLEVATTLAFYELTACCRAEVPDGFNGVVAGQHRGQLVALPGDDIKRSSREI